MPIREPQVDCSAVILSGGLNSRMGGRNKAFLTVGKKTILERLLDTLRGLFAEILLVTRQPELYRGQPIKVVEDILPQRSSLTGIHAGLMRSEAAFAFVVPCDTPFLQPALVRMLLGEIDPALDVIVPAIGDRFEPLCAVYSKRCIPFIEAQLNREDFKIIHFYRHIRLKALPGSQLREVDAALVSFLNVNNPEAYRFCQELDGGLVMGLPAKESSVASETGARSASQLTDNKP